MNRSRSQSHAAPRRFSWFRIVPPLCSFHFQTRSMKASRPSSCREIPSFPSSRSTTFWVAIPAWSVPGSQRALRPFIRAYRRSTSCSVMFSACPMWREPVTFGGGMTIVNGSPGRDGSA